MPIVKVWRTKNIQIKAKHKIKKIKTINQLYLLIVKSYN